MRGEALPPMTEAEKMQPAPDAQDDPTPAPEADGARAAGFAAPQQPDAHENEPFIDPDDAE